MSEVDIGGHNIKEWSLLLLIGGIVTVFVVFAIGFAVAITSSPQIVVKGEIDLSQFTGVIIGIALIAVTLITQQLTAKLQTNAVANTDKVWLKSEELAKGKA